MLIGIVGKPSTGKSTFFMAATSATVERSARPFTTIKPNHAVGYVEVECVDKEFGVQCNPRTGFCINSRRFVPIDLLDVAGLVPGAHKGKGLGNKFLDDLRQADVLIHIVDASGSTNETGEKVPPGSYDPCNDVRFLEEELDYWIKGILERNWKKLEKEAKHKGKNEEVFAEQFSGLGIDRETIAKVLKELAVEERALEEWGEDEIMAFAKKIRHIGKPTIIAANKCDLPHGMENFEKLKKEFPDYLVVPCSSEAEIALKEAAKNEYIEYIPGDRGFEIKDKADEQQQKALELLKDVCEKCNGTGVQKCLNSAVFDFLDYIAVFPGGVGKLEDSEGRVLPDCYLMPPGTTALDFAYRLHSDMGEGFIKAIDVKKKQVIGKGHVLKHRDVVEIYFKKK
ncbi:redox-regulated ATPase YchF [Candidatus Micrarchaeota archaeon]|nr:redox-regulated ATPase YchF [Candidatus Micrarchaeota archaeon]